MEDFNIIAPLGFGAQGSVFLVGHALDDRLYAQKVIQKSYVHTHRFYKNVQLERDILISNRSPWLGRAYHAFQNATHLSLIMEYAPGGDIMSLLMEHDLFGVNVAKFYITECILAVKELHEKGFIHRDLKPDNVLLDKSGHVKLTDFGMATSIIGDRYEHDSYLDLLYAQRVSYPRRASEQSGVLLNQAIIGRPKMHGHRRSQTSIAKFPSTEYKNSSIKRKRRFHSMVGTLDYISPEILNRETGYTKLCDSWSLGVILYEMLYGFPPFLAETQEETSEKIRNWENVLVYHDHVYVPSDALHFLKKLLCDEKDRMDIQEMLEHPFLRGLDYNNIRRQTPPFIPELKSPTDTKYFPTSELEKIEQASIPRLSEQIYPDSIFENFDY